MDKAFLWTEEGLRCPNGCGLMVLVALDLLVAVPEARLRCLVCGHTNLVAWERGDTAPLDGHGPLPPE